MKRALLLIVCILMASCSAHAADFFVRPAGGNYGLENGTSFSNAWDGFDSIDWKVLKGGETQQRQPSKKSIQTRTLAPANAPSITAPLNTWVSVDFTTPVSAQSP